MSNYQSNPKYYQVTWTLNSPTDYSTVGGISPFNSIQFFNTVAVTGTAASPTLSNGDTILLNNYVIGPFTSSDTLSIIASRFNIMSQYTGVMASIANTNYLALQSINPTSGAITLSNQSGTPLTTLGLQATGFKKGSAIYGGSFTPLTNGQTVVINGTTITFTGSNGTTPTLAAATLNTYYTLTGVNAVPYESAIQLNSSAPVYFGTGTGTTSLGFTSNTAYGGGMTSASALAIEQANMRWNGILSSIESILTPSSYNLVNMTGAVTDGSVLPTTVTWTIGINNIDNLYVTTLTGEPETVGTQLYGIKAVTRLVSRALLNTYSENRNVFNNIINVVGTDAARGNPATTTLVTAGPIDVISNLATLEGNITTVLVSNA